MRRFEGRVVFVTGAGSGVGRATAGLFADEGAKVFGVDVNRDGITETVTAIKKAGGKPKYTEYPGVGHNSWDRAYGTKELWTWLLEQKKK